MDQFSFALNLTYIMGAIVAIAAVVVFKFAFGDDDHKKDSKKP